MRIPCVYNDLLCMLQHRDALCQGWRRIGEQCALMFDCPLWFALVYTLVYTFGRRKRLTARPSSHVLMGAVRCSPRCPIWGDALSQTTNWCYTSQQHEIARSIQSIRWDVLTTNATHVTDPAAAHLVRVLWFLSGGRQPNALRYSFRYSRERRGPAGCAGRY